MAEITIKGYYPSDYEQMSEDLINLLGAVKTDDKLWINDYTYIKLYNNSGKPPQLRLYHNGLLVHSFAYGASSNNMSNGDYSKFYTGVLTIRTNSATLLAFSGDNSDLRKFAQECLIFADAEHHKQGVIKPVASVFKSESGSFSHYICAEDASNAEILFSPSSYYSRKVTYNADITVLEPFVDTRTTTSLRGVYTLATSQMPNDFIGECTLNGRSYYSYNRILIEDN